MPRPARSLLSALLPLGLCLGLAAISATGLAADPAPAAPADLLQQGVTALQEKRVDEAVTLLGQCVKADPQSARCWWELGWAYYVKRDWPAVIRAWTEVQRLDPAWPDLEKNLAQARSMAVDGSQMDSLRAAAPATFPAATGAAIRLRAVGDLMIGTDFPAGALPPDDGAGAFAKVKTLLQDADITFGNLEGPLCDGGQTTKCGPDSKPGSCYAFRTPTRYAKYYKEAGFDLLSTANNHAGDFGAECRLQTEAALDGQGIRYSGRLGVIASTTANNKKIAMIGFATYAPTYDLNQTAEAVALIKAQAATHDIVIVSFHGGAEGSRAIRVPSGAETFYGENRGDLRMFTHAAIDAGADIVLGHGPHVLRGMELYKNRLIAYSLGNFATYGRFNLSGNQGIGLILEASLGADGAFMGGKLIGTRQEGQGIPVPDPKNAAADLVRLLTTQDFSQYGIKVAQDGSIGR